MIAEHRHHRQFHVGQQRLLAERVQVLLERVRQVDDRPGLDHVPGVGVAGRCCSSSLRDQRELLLGVDAVLGIQGAVQVTLHQVVQVEGGLTGPGQVGGQRGVAGDAVDRPAAGGQRIDRGLEVVTDLGRGRVGEPGRPAPPRRPGRRRPRRPPPPRRRRPRTRGCARRHRPGAQVPRTTSPTRPVRVLVQPGPDGARGEPRAGHLEALGAGLVLLHEGLQQALAQHPELQVVEDPVHGLPVVRQPGSRWPGRASIGTSRTNSVSRRFISTCGSASRSASPTLPRTSSTRSTRVVRLPNSRIHFVAVFSPTPGMPGRLSDGSPRRAA